LSISACVRSGAEGETGLGVVRKGRAAKHVAGAFLLGLALVHVLVLVLGDGVKASAVGNAKEMTSSRSSSGLVFGIFLDSYESLGTSKSTTRTRPVTVSGNYVRWRACGGVVCVCKGAQQGRRASPTFASSQTSPPPQQFSFRLASHF